MRKRMRLWVTPPPPSYTYEEHINNKEAEYLTQVGVTGELILYRITLHQLLSAKMEPVIWKVWAAGEWTRMVHDEVEDGDD